MILNAAYDIQQEKYIYKTWLKLCLTSMRWVHSRCVKQSNISNPTPLFVNLCASKLGPEPLTATKFAKPLATPSSFEVPGIQLAGGPAVLPQLQWGDHRCRDLRCPCGFAWFCGDGQTSRKKYTGERCIICTIYLHSLFQMSNDEQ